MKRRIALLLIVAALPLHLVSATPAAAAPCHSGPSFLLAEQGGGTLGIDPVTGATGYIEVAPGVIERARDLRRTADRLIAPEWDMTRTGGDRTFQVTVSHHATDQVVFDVAFDRRIELAAIAGTPDGRFTLVVQANNIASEVTILDARTGAIREVAIAHDADLAAYAIAIAFDPGQCCAAISMERVNGPGAETWLLGLPDGSVDSLPVTDAFVIDWVRGR